MQLEPRFPARLKRPVVVFFSALLLAAIAGCHHAPGPDVVATVNGKEILRSDLDKFYQAQVNGSTPQPSPEQADLLRLNILHQMIEDEIIQQRAAKLNLVASDEDVNAKLTEMKAPYTEEQFDQQLKQRNITLDDLKRIIRRQLTQTKLINKEIDSKINVTEAEITDYYNAHKTDFNLIEPRYGLSQIIVSGNPPQQGANQQAHHAPNEAEARKEIEAIRTRLLSGEDFATLAAQFSENANNASNGGDMGFIYESQLKQALPDVFDAVSKLKPGEFTAPIPVYDSPARKTVVGYAIYRLNSHEAAGQRDLNDPRTHEFIREGLRDRKGQLLKTAYLEELHDQSTVHNYLAEQILKQYTP